MGNYIAEAIVRLKTEFVRSYKGSSHLHEVVPLFTSDLLPISDRVLGLLHKFAANNPIYFRSHDLNLLGIPCRVYEGDINEFWLGSIKHDTSYQPFYPTWILSAYAIAETSKGLGFEQLVDIGSGDGRIAYCSQAAGICSYGIEIDEDLIMLQESISSSTGVECDARRADATSFDYSSLNLTRPIFFISGLPEMGEMLANSVISRIMLMPGLKRRAGFTFLGSHALKKYSRDQARWGWGKIIEDHNLRVVEMVTLPTYWTTDEAVDTPYIFTVSAAQ